MWKLIKASIEYNNILFLTLYSVLIPLVVLNTILRGFDELLLKMDISLRGKIRIDLIPPAFAFRPSCFWRYIE